MVNYQNGKIYSIRSPHTQNVYIGSTSQSLYKRFHSHKSNYKCWLKGIKTVHTSSFEIIKLGDAYIELIENYPCNDRNELNRREGQIMRETKNCINKLMAGRTYKEYCEDTKEYQKERHKKYQEKNMEKIKKNRSRIVDCECGKQYTHGHKARHFKSKKHQSFVQNQKK